MVPPAQGVREGLRGGAWARKLCARRAIQHQGRAAWQYASKRPSGKTRRVAGSFLDAENCSSLLAHLAKTDFAWLAVDASPRVICASMSATSGASSGTNRAESSRRIYSEEPRSGCSICKPHSGGCRGVGDRGKSRPKKGVVEKRPHLKSAPIFAVAT